jgi:DNA-binding transcriptional ArsR family regulator
MHEFEFSVPEIDRTVHEPARLAILSILSSCEQADFLFLERATGLSRGNLSVQLTRLEESGLVEIWKTIERKRTLTTAALTDMGRTNLTAYWESMEAYKAAAKQISQSRSESDKPTRHRRPSLTPLAG